MGTVHQLLLGDELLGFANDADADPSNIFELSWC